MSAQGEIRKPNAVNALGIVVKVTEAPEDRRGKFSAEEAVMVSCRHGWIETRGPPACTCILACARAVVSGACACMV